MTALASARGLAFAYPGGTQALAGADLDLEPGTITGLIGANGSGKSTLMKAFAGVLPVREGDVKWEGGFERSRIAYLPQHADLDPEMTIEETLRLFAALHGCGRERVAAVRTAFGLAPLADRLVARCSGGQRQRLHLALGFIPDAALILADEPTLGLDPEGREAFWATLAERTLSGAAALVILHDMRETEEMCPRVGVMVSGRVAALASPEELIARHAHWTWTADLAKLLDDAGAWTREAESIAGIARARNSGARLEMDLGPEGPPDADLMALAEKHGARVIAYERRRPDLLGVFRSFGPRGDRPGGDGRGLADGRQGPAGGRQGRGGGAGHGGGRGGGAGGGRGEGRGNRGVNREDPGG